jgi:hypothetical protein
MEPYVTAESLDVVAGRWLAVIVVSALVSVAGLLSGCGKSNNLILGRVEAQVGRHTVVVTDCYRTSVPAPEMLENTSDGQAVYRFTPCRDADIFIRGNELIVNGRSYGQLKEGDTVMVDHGKVSIQGEMK